MIEIQLMTYSLLLFVAHRVVNPANERDMDALREYRRFFEAVARCQGDDETEDDE